MVLILAVHVANATGAQITEVSRLFTIKMEDYKTYREFNIILSLMITYNCPEKYLTSELDLTLDALPTAALVSDIIYTPLETRLLAAARQRGNMTINGLGMLLHQGKPAWRMWFDVEPEVTDELRQNMEASIRGDN